MTTMATAQTDKTGKQVTFMLDGDPQPYTLTYDFNMIVKAEQKAGLNLMQGTMNGGAGLIRGLLFAFLLKAHPNVTIEEAGDLLSKDTGRVMANFQKIMANLSMDDENVRETEFEEYGTPDSPSSPLSVPIPNIG